MIPEIVVAMFWGALAVVLFLGALFNMRELIFNKHIPTRNQWAVGLEILSSIICLYIAIKFLP